MITRALCIEDFFETPDEVREYALSLDYYKSSDGAWPGTRTHPLSEVYPEYYDYFCQKIYALLPEFDSPNYYMDLRFQLVETFENNKRSYKNRGFIHEDQCPYAGLVYLTPNIEKDCGTSLFEITKPERFIEYSNRERIAKGKYYCAGIDENYDECNINNDYCFEETVRFNNVYNRMIGYDGNLYHRANSFYSTVGARLTQVFFIKIRE